jgi:Yip1 domain
MSMYQQSETPTFQTMLNSSLAVLQHPAVATFEEHERNNLQWATLYVVVAAVVSGVLAAIGTAIKQTAGPGLVGAIFGTLIGVLIGFFIWLGLVYLLGRAFGGTGNFGELAFDISLFYAPLLVVFNLLSMIAIGPLGILTAIAGLVVWIYQLYLTYLGIQSGMNLPANKALWVILILFLIGLALVACFVLVIVGLLATFSRSANP